MKTLLYESEVRDAFHKQLKTARSLCVAEALITSNGLKLVIEDIEDFLERGGSANLLVGFDLPTEPQAVDSLLDLQKSFPKTFKVRRFESKLTFHPKFIVFGDQRQSRCAIIGSSNLTHGGWESNYEANVFVSETAVVKKLADYFDELFLGAYAWKISTEWMRDYRRLWKLRERLRNQQRAITKKVRTIKAQKVQGPARIKGNAFCFTGRIVEYPREKRLYPLVRKLGGSVVREASRVGSGASLVHGEILGERGTTLKLKKARKGGIPIIREDDFFALVEKERRIQH